MRKDAVATIHLAIADRSQANGPNAVKKILAQAEVIDIRRRRSLPLHVDIARIVHAPVKAGMCFQPASVRHVDGTRGDIIDRGAAVGIEGQARAVRRFQSGKPDFLCGTGERWRRERRNPLRGPTDGRICRRTPLRIPRWQACGPLHAARALIRLRGDGWSADGRDRRDRKALVEGIRRWSNAKRWSKDKRRHRGTGDSDRVSVSPRADTKVTSVPRLATRTREPSDICDPTEAGASPDGRANPNANPATSAAIPAGSKRIPTLTKNPPYPLARSPWPAGRRHTALPDSSSQRAEHCGEELAGKNCSLWGQRGGRLRQVDRLRRHASS